MTDSLDYNGSRGLLHRMPEAAIYYLIEILPNGALRTAPIAIQCVAAVKCKKDTNRGDHPTHCEEKYFSRNTLMGILGEKIHIDFAKPREL